MDPIHYVIYRRHLDPALTDSEVRGYALRLEALIRSAYPSASVEVEVRDRVSGVGDGYRGDDLDVRDHLAALADRAWNAGVGGCAVRGCDRPIYANGRCEAHDRRARRGSLSTSPVRARGTEPLERLSVRLPRSVYQALGEEPGARLREIAVAWAKRQGRR